jgi:ketosteroid isomerase-like protein
LPDVGASSRGDLDRFITEYHLALDAFFRGDPEPCKNLFSHRDDVSLANPFGPPALGWRLVAKTMEQAAAHYQDGRAIGFDRVAEYTTGELAYIVEMEHYEAKVENFDDFALIDLRVTTVLRPEAKVWKIVHRHADPITTLRAAESVIQ